MSSPLTAQFRKWLAIGTGVGVEAGAADLRVVVTRVRPSGASVLGATLIPRFRERPAAEWGAEYTAFLKRLGASHLAATVLLPRRDVIVRLLSLPGVPDRELAAAIRFQIDSLHPYAEEDALHAWARIPGADAVLIGIAGRQAIERYIALFDEAGIKVASFTFSAAAIYSAIRLLAAPPAGGILAAWEDESALELYGESEARPVFSAQFPPDRERALAMGAAELRLENGREPRTLDGLLPAARTFPMDFDLPSHALAYAGGLAGACPRLALPVNLLPAQHRGASSRAMFVPTAALAVLLAVAGAGLAAISPLEDRRYLAALQAEIARLEPQARQAATLDYGIEAARARARLLDDFRRRSKADLDALQELTRLLAPPAWLNQLEITREAVVLAGEAEQAAPLLKLLDESPLLHNSEFTMPMARMGAGETFRIRAAREGVAQ